MTELTQSTMNNQAANMNMENDSEATMNMNMKMFFHFQKELVVLFEEWEISSTKGLIGSCVAMFILAVLYEGLKQWRARLLRHHARPRAVHHETATTNPGDPDTLQPHLDNVEPRTWSRKNFTCLHFSETLIHMLQVVVGYILMLVVMTYNVWLCLAVVLGMGLGYFVMVGLSAGRRPKVRSTSHKRDSVVMLNVRQLKEPGKEPEKSGEIDTNENEDRQLGEDSGSKYNPGLLVSEDD